MKRSELFYKSVLPNEEWIRAGEMIVFFKVLGEFLNKNKQYDFFINYLDETIPAILISLGIIKDYYNELSERNLYDDEFLSNLFVEGDKINYLDNKDNKWYQVKVIGVENKEGSIYERFNPYLNVEGIFGKGSTVKLSIPYSKWINNIRMSDVVKHSPGRSKVVYLEDEISDVIPLRYSEKLANWLKMNSEKKINLVGWGIERTIKETLNKIQLRDEKGSYLASDFLYLDTDYKTNYVNVRMVSGQNPEVIEDKTSVSVFLGARNALRYAKHRTLRNIYITNRIRIEYYEDVSLLVNNLNQFSEKTNKERTEFLDDLYLYLSTYNIGIPKGVEIYAF